MYTVMPWIEGVSLRELLDQEGPLELPEVLWIVEQIARALASAHTIGVVHRDVKPANVLVDMHGVPVLCDFGIAKSLEAPDVTVPGVGPGSPAYMAPEQIRGAAEPASDQYALGIMAFELITGFRPYTGAAIDVQMAHLSAPPPPFHDITDRAGRSLPPEIVSTFSRLVRKSAHDRWPSIEDCVDAAASATQFRGHEARTRLAARVARGRLRRVIRERMDGDSESSESPSDASRVHMRWTPPANSIITDIDRSSRADPDAEQDAKSQTLESSSVGEPSQFVETATSPTPRRRRVVPALLIGAIVAVIPAIVWLGQLPGKPETVNGPRIADSSNPPPLVAVGDTSKTSSSFDSLHAEPSIAASGGRQVERSTPGSTLPRAVSSAAAGTRDREKGKPSKSPDSLVSGELERIPSPETNTLSILRSDIDSMRPESPTSSSTRPSLSQDTPVAPPPSTAPSTTIPAVQRALSQLLQLRDTGLQSRLSGPGATTLMESLREARWPSASVIVDSIAGEIVHAHALYGIRNAIGRRETWIARFQVHGNDLHGKWVVNTWRRTTP